MQTENVINEGRSGAILLNAYKREFAFLEAERDALRQQIAELDQRMSAKVQKARSAVITIQKTCRWARLESCRTSENTRRT